MGSFGKAVLYTALTCFANTAVADTAALEALREGDMRKLAFLDTPRDPVEVGFVDEDGAELTLAQWHGQWVVLNFWATWCAPCREEMPTLEALAGEMEGRNLAVLTIATGRNSPQGISRFFSEAGVENLPRHTDPGGALARTMGVMGLPVTLILDPEGREVARLIGEADWNAPEAHAILEALMEGDQPG